MAHAAAEDTQVNTRINKKLKEKGDAAFKALGITPSQAIRGFYEFAASNRYHPERVAEVIGLQNDADEAAREAERKRRLKKLEDSRKRIEDLKKQLGVENVSWSDVFGDKTDKEILEEARYDRAVEKGWF